MAKKSTLEVPGFEDAFAKDLAENGLGEVFKRAADRDDMTVEVLTTGLPRLDQILHATKLGLARGRHIEIFSKDPEVGKTSIALQIGSHWQKLGQRVVIEDIEDTLTNDYLEEVGFILKPAPDSGMFAPYLAKGFNSETGELYTAEEVLDNTAKIARISDLVIVDSLGALAKRADVEKETGDPSQMGGIGKLMHEYKRKVAHIRATVIWINQALPQIGVFSPAGIKYKTSGGNALPTLSTIRLELYLAAKLKDKNENTFGVLIDVHTFKNKVSPPYKHVKLTYIDGEGFSVAWDLLEAAKALKVIEKSGSWLQFGDLRLQGDMQFYQAMKADPELIKSIQAKVDEASHPAEIKD